MKMQPVDVDFEVFQAIQAERRGFEDTPNAALRRLLKLCSSVAAQSETENVATTPRSDPSSWLYKGVSLPDGTALRMLYKGKKVTGTVEAGKWLVGGRNFTSPSEAACFVAKTLNGKQTSLNGWIYWQAKLPKEQEWLSIDELRRPSSIDVTALTEKILADLGIS
jgi:hypothetical protein